MNKNTFHILIVDDDDRIRELVKEYLEENNFLITTAKDSFDAKKKLEIIINKFKNAESSEIASSVLLNQL